MQPLPAHYRIAGSPWVEFVGPWAALAPDHRAAVLALIAPRYLELSYPTPHDFAVAYDVDLDTPAYHAKHAELVAFCADALDAAYADHDIISVLFIRTLRDTLAAVATIQTVRGTRQVPIGASIGDETSSIPTHRMLRGFRYPAELPFDPAVTPEAALAEYSRLAVADADQQQALLDRGDLLPTERQYLVQHGVDDVLVRAHRFVQAQPDPPRAYIFNQKPRLSQFFRRKGLHLQPLYHVGVELTPKLRTGGKLSSAYFNRWWDELGAVVPPPVLEAGLAPAIRYLVDEQPHLLNRVAISLPGLLLNDNDLAAAIERLDEQCHRPIREDERHAAD